MCEMYALGLTTCEMVQDLDSNTARGLVFGDCIRRPLHVPQLFRKLLLWSEFSTATKITVVANPLQMIASKSELSIFNLKGFFISECG